MLGIYVFNAITSTSAFRQVTCVKLILRHTHSTTASDSTVLLVDFQSVFRFFIRLFIHSLFHLFIHSTSSERRLEWVEMVSFTEQNSILNYLCSGISHLFHWRSSRGGGGGGARAPPPPLSKVGGTSGFVPPPPTFGQTKCSKFTIFSYFVVKNAFSSKIFLARFARKL